MAEAFANYYGRGRVEATSAGIKPADRVNPMVIEVMREKGIDLSEKKPKDIDPKVVQEADLIVTMGCGAEEVCPGPMLGKAIEWKIENPKDKPIGEVRRIRDQIEKNVRGLLDQI